MTSVMPHDRGRAKKISRIVGLQKDTNRVKVIVKGKVERLPAYSLRLDELHYNKSNGRIKAEVYETEQQLGRDLDMDNRDDRYIIRNLLLSMRRDENANIK